MGAALDVVEGPIDTLVVPGTWTWPATVEDRLLMQALSAAAARSRRLAGVCMGAFLMAEAGLLDGRRATTQWEFLDAMEERLPEVGVEREAIFVSDGPAHTSAGGAAGIDLASSLVENDHGPELATRIARHLVVFMQRPGGHAQLSVRLRLRPVDRAPLRPLLDAIAADPAGDHRLAMLESDPGVFTTTPHYDGHPMVRVRLDAVDEERLRAVLEDSWRLRAPERLREAADRGEGGPGRPAG